MLEKTLNQKLLHKGYFLDFVEDDIELDTDPPQNGKRQYFKHPGGVCILPILDSGDIVLVKQFRKPVEQAIYEIPAGKVNPGEDRFVTAQRELKEETGYSAKQWQKLGEIMPCPGYSTEILDLYLATELTAGTPNPDPGEIVETYQFSQEEIQTMIMQSEIQDGKTICALHYYAIARKNF